jgi:hypothetical protein
MGRAIRNNFETVQALQNRANELRAIADRLPRDDHRNFLWTVAEELDDQAKTASYRATLKLNRLGTNLRRESG